MGSLVSGQFVDDIDINPITANTGDLKWVAGFGTPSGWVACNGQQLDRTTFSDLFGVLVPFIGNPTVTIASPGVFTLTSHGFVVGSCMFLTTTGALPTGLAANTLYYVVSVPTTDTFTVSATLGGSAINTSGTQSGTHAAYRCPWGNGNGSTTFNVPDFRGRMMVGVAGSTGNVAVSAVGLNDGVSLANRRPQHRHTPHSHTQAGGNTISGAGTSLFIIGGNTVGSITTATADGGSGVSTDSLDTPSFATARVLIKT